MQEETGNDTSDQAEVVQLDEEELGLLSEEDKKGYHEAQQQAKLLKAEADNINQKIKAAKEHCRTSLAKARKERHKRQRVASPERHLSSKGAEATSKPSDSGKGEEPPSGDGGKEEPSKEEKIKGYRKAAEEAAKKTLAKEMAEGKQSG